MGLRLLVRGTEGHGGLGSRDDGRELSVSHAYRQVVKVGFNTYQSPLQPHISFITYLSSTKSCD